MNVYDFDFVVHYIFETKLVGIYPLAGVNYIVETEEGHDAERAVGAVFGAGIHRNFNKVTFFGEYARVQSNLDDHLFTFGLMYSFK